MENASKALIIAGSVLIAVMLVTLGIFVFNTVANKATDTSKLTEQEIASFNSIFSGYEGESVPGVRVNALIKTVMNSNISSAVEEKGTYITIKYPASSGGTVSLGVNNKNEPKAVINGGLDNPISGGTDYNSVTKTVSTTHIYSVKINKNNKTGIIKTIEVTQK